MASETLDYQTLRSAVEGSAVAIRSVTDLDPAGGSGDKLFPPTYEGGTYAFETRIVDGEPVNCVLLDSVQSQANRLEEALLYWHRSVASSAEKPFPLVQIDFGGTDVADVGLFSVLEAPHRIADAVFLASEIEETDSSGKPRKLPFRHPGDVSKGSHFGRQIEAASPSRATDLFGLCPSALIFGMWDSHGARGGIGEKFQRVITSEIFGVGATTDNRRPASRVDPLLTVAGESLPIVIHDDRTWSVSEGKGTGTKRLSEVGLGNVTPSLKSPRDREYNHGGVTVKFARQISVVSLSALRRLRFPITDGRAEGQHDADVSARTTLAALSLAALSQLWGSGYGFDLRSRCVLRPRGDLSLSILDAGTERSFALDVESAAALLLRAVAEARGTGLPWPTHHAAPPPWRDGSLSLSPNASLAQAVARSRELAREQRDKG